MSLSLAVRYRPHKFSELVGQKHIAAVLRASVNATLDGQAPPFQQILLSGPSGLGKTTTARIFAAALNCQTPNEQRETPGDACGVCKSCIDIWSSQHSHPDVIELDAASSGGKDEIKDIAAKASLSPVMSAFKIYILDEAHGISSAGNQAFLKLLEEPPPHVIFCLATTDPDKLAKPVRGRCREFKVQPPTKDELANNLLHVASKENWSLSIEAAQTIVDATDSSAGIRGTLMSLEKFQPDLTAQKELTVSYINTMLDSLDTESLTNLLESLSNFDSSKALSILDSLTTSPSKVHQSLLEWATEEQNLLDNLWRYELILESPVSKEWNRLLVMKLTSPQIEPETEVLKSLLASAEQTIADLTKLLSQARTETSAPSSTKVESTVSSNVSSSTLEIQDQIQEILTAKPKTRLAAALISNCEIQKTGEASYRILVPKHLQDKALKIKLSSLLSKVSEDLNVTLLMEML